MVLWPVIEGMCTHPYHSYMAGDLQKVCSTVSLLCGQQMLVCLLTCITVMWPVNVGMFTHLYQGYMAGMFIHLYQGYMAGD